MSQPRSIRLNQSHRKDIVNAVMAEWVKNNPEPEEYGYGKMVVDVLLDSKKAKRKSKVQKQNAELIKSSEALVTAIKDIPENISKHLQVKLNHFMHVTTVSSDGSESFLGRVRLPLQVMESNGFTLMSQDYVLASNFEEYGEIEHDSGPGYVKCAGFVSNSDNRTYVRIDRNSPFYTKHRESLTARNEWRKERDRNREEVTDYLNQFNTTKQIREGWPELVDYLPAHLADPEAVIQLPVLAVSRLNERLGLK